MADDGPISDLDFTLMKGLDYIASAIGGEHHQHPVGESIQRLADAVNRGMSGDNTAPGAVEAIAMAISGDGMNYPIGPAIERNADANHRIADALENIAQAISEKG